MTESGTTILATRSTASTDGNVQEPDPVPAVDTVHLLHVEDNPADAELIQAYVRDVLPHATFDNAERLAELTMDRVLAADCVIVDLSLPDASGLEALTALRGMSADVPIIVLTGLDDLPLGLSALRNGAEDYLVKNHVDGYTLERAVRYAIERRRLTQDVTSAVADSLVAAAAVITAEAAQTKTSRSAHPDVEARSEPEPATELKVAGSHQVAVQMNQRR